jgi:hypothetical protein
LIFGKLMPMITYDNLSRKPSAFKSMVGMDPPDFDTLYAEFAPAHLQRLQHSPVTKRTQQPRQRAVGAGRKHAHDLCDRLLMALFWLRVYPTYEVLGFFFSLDPTNAEDNVKEVLSTLHTLSPFTFDLPGPEREKLRSPQAVMEAYPDVRWVIDAKEQRIQRPKSSKDDDRQKPYYSGKKKTHTIKNQIAVRPDGLIESVSDSVSGGANHDLTLLRQTGLLDRLADGEAAMMDKGYDGIRNDYPERTIYHPDKARRNHPLTEEQKEANRHLSSCRIVVEHTIAQLNKFQVLAQEFRHALGSHPLVMRVVAWLVNRRIAVKPLKAYGAVA